MTFEDTVVSLGNYVCPIFRRDDMGRPDFVGTGTLASIGGHHFIITASHVLDKLEADHIILAGSDRLLRFPRKSVQYAHDPTNSHSIDADIGVAYMPPEAAASISTRFTFTAIDDWGEFCTYNKFTLYAFLGYPSTKAKVPYKQPTKWEFKSFFFVLREFVEVDSIDSQGKRNTDHVAMRANYKKFTTFDFKRQIMPDPHGVSGGGLWRVFLDPNTGVPSKPKLVGIGIETLKQPDCFLFTKIGLSFKLIADLISELNLPYKTE